MSIRLELYRVFDTVTKYGSFSKAAKKLYMTQPAVSQSIMQLEDELQVRLFTRTPRGVVLTNEGKILYQYTNAAISLIDNGESKIREFRDLTGGELKIGVSDTISRYFLLPYLETFNIAYSNIKLKIINRTTDEICSLLKSGEIDIGICNLPILDSSLDITQCKDIEDVFVGNKKFKQLIKGKIKHEELTKYPLIFLDSKSRSRQYVEKYLESKKVKINPEIELGTYELVTEFAKKGLGIACVVKEFVEDALRDESLFVIDLTEGIPKRNIGICSLKGVSFSPASEKFVEYLLSGELNIETKTNK